MHKKWTRKTLVDENLLAYKDCVSISERNIQIVEGYAKGMTLGQLGKEYSISSERVREIIVTYIIHCHWYIKGRRDV